VSFLCGVDIGGTFTDAVVLDPDGLVHVGKRSSTPPDFAVGFFDALEAAGAAGGVKLPELLEQTSHLIHGTTVATNVMVQRAGAKVGLITTRGHGDTLLVMRAIGRVKGRSIEEVVRLSASRKPDPIVPRALIEEIDERVDCNGEVVVELDERGAREAIARLRAAGVEAIAISFLWSFLNPEHERRVRALVEETAPGLFVSASCDLIPKWGEYERTAAVAVNAYVGPSSAAYIESLRARLAESGYAGPLHMLGSTGGVLPAESAVTRPVLLLGSGPVAGVTASAQLESAKAFGDVIHTDMGGTSFDVGLVVDGVPGHAETTVVDQYEIFTPVVEVQSIGSGGGSIVWVEPNSDTLRVGPASAGAIPGPACYGRGATAPTVTDANLVLGYLNPEYFLGGGMALDSFAAHRALGAVGDAVGMSTIEAAVAAIEIVNHQMGDLIRRISIERGRHPRDFTVFCCGGAAGLHATRYTRLLGSRRAVIPLGASSSVWSALGAAASDLLYVEQRSLIRAEPLPPADLVGAFGSLEGQARQQLHRDGVADADIRIERTADLKYAAQVNVVETTVELGDLEAGSTAALRTAFATRYERLYGPGSGMSDGGLELTGVRIRAVGIQPKPALARFEDVGEVPAAAARVGSRSAWDATGGGFAEFEVWLGEELAPGNRVDGPAIVELPSTTVVLHAEDSLLADSFGNLVCDVGVPA
jgi:N-methylhydantoinase A